MFNVTAFDTCSDHEVGSCLQDMNYQANSGCICFRLLLQTCQKDQPRFAPEVTLHGVVLDWSDAEANAAGSDMADRPVKGCQGHWAPAMCKMTSSKANGRERKCLEIGTSVMLLPNLQKPLLSKKF